MFDMREFANDLVATMAKAQSLSAPNIKREPCPHCHATGEVTVIHPTYGIPVFESCAWCAGKGYVVVESIEVTP